MASYKKMFQGFVQHTTKRTSWGIHFAYLFQKRILVTKYLFIILYWNSRDFVSNATRKGKLWIFFQSKQTPLKLSLNFEWAVGGVAIPETISLKTFLKDASVFEASWLLRTSWIWSWITKCLLFMYPFIFRDCRHGAGIASTKDIKSKISFGEKFTRLWLHWKINWFFSVTKSPILTISLLTRLWLKTDLLLIQTNLLFQRTVLEICSCESPSTLLPVAVEQCEKHSKHSL